MERENYPTDLTSEQWQIVQPLIPPPKLGGRPRKTDIREVLDGIFYLLRSAPGVSCHMIFPLGKRSIPTFASGKKMVLGKTSMTPFITSVENKMGVS